MKRYIQCGAEYRISPSSDPYQNYVATGLNTGNLYIGHAVNKLFKTKNSFNLWRPLSEDQIEEIRDSSDIIVMGASNFINPSTDFGVPAENLKKLKLPTIVLGIGAQAPNDTVKKIPLTKGTKEFLHQISEQSVSIGVRGEYTAELLNNMGIKNITIIGCPTYYLNLDINFKVNMQKMSKEGDLRPVLNYTNISQKCDEKIFKYAFEHGLDVIGQTEYVEEYWKRGLDINLDKVISAEEKKIQQYKKIGSDMNAIKGYFEKHFYQFYDIDQWTEQIKKYNFVFGTRFHGNMVAVQNGIPALLVTHDSRTKELAEYCNIPYIEASNLVGEIDLLTLYSEMNYQKFNNEYPEKFRKYVDFLKLNNVTDVDSLLVNQTENSKQSAHDAEMEQEIIKLNYEKNISIMSNRISKLFNTHQLFYTCPLENIAKLKSGPSVQKYTIEEDGLHMEVIGSDPHLILPNFINFEKNVLYVKITLTSHVKTILEIFYEDGSTSTNYPYNEERKVSHELNTGKNELYLAIESDSPIKSLRLDIGKEPGKYVLHDLVIRA